MNTLGGRNLGFRGQPLANLAELAGAAYSSCVPARKSANHHHSPNDRVVPIRSKKNTATPARSCGLCGKTRRLTKTECCNRWICDDEDTYVMFSYARNSCHRNHRRQTICAYHSNEEHDGRWQDCGDCAREFPTEMYVWYATNEYNFEVLQNPPSFAPTYCAGCGSRLSLPNGGYSLEAGKYWCTDCSPPPVMSNPGARPSRRRTTQRRN